MARKYRGSEVPRPFNPATIKRMIEGPMRIGPMQPFGEAYGLRKANVQGGPTLAPAILSPLALAGPAELGDGRPRRVC